MNEFFNKFLIDRKWFIGTIIVILILFFFFWKIIDPESFAKNMSNFFQTMFEILKSIFILAIVILGIRVMFGHKPWWMGKK